jgi:hypothetical protein
MLLVHIKNKILYKSTYAYYGSRIKCKDCIVLYTRNIILKPKNEQLRWEGNVTSYEHEKLYKILANENNI